MIHGTFMKVASSAMLPESVTIADAFFAAYMNDKYDWGCIINSLSDFKPRLSILLFTYECSGATIFFEDEFYDVVNMVLEPKTTLNKIAIKENGQIIGVGNITK